MRSGADLTLVNGEPAGTLSVFDRALHYGDGLFETIACHAGRARFLAFHLERLSAGCERLSIAVEMSAVRREIETLAAGADRSTLKLIVTRGDLHARGYSFTGSEVANRIAFRFRSDGADAPVVEGVRVRTARMRLGENPALAGMKHLNRLEQVLARAELRGGTESDLLMFSSSGALVSGTMSNVFIVHDGRLITPRLDLCGVAGVMRRVVLREANRAGIAVEERSIDARELGTAQEIFLTSARIGVQPVGSLDGRALQTGQVTRQLQALIAEAGDA